MRTGERKSIRRCHPLRAATIALLSASLWSTASFAGEIYHWVDEDGVAQYSDTQPHQAVPVKVLEIETSQPTDYDPVEDPYSILNQASRIHQIWLDYEAARQARVRERLDASAYGTTSSPTAYDSYYEFSTYPYSYYSGWPARGPDYRPSHGRDQLDALDALDLSGRRPQSINSGTHQDRVTRSQRLPIAPPTPRLQPR